MFKKIGSWLFLIGILVAVIVGLVMGYYITEGTVSLDPATIAENPEWTTTVGGLLAGLGFVVGVLSFFAIGTITQEKVPTFLIGALVLVGIGILGSTWQFGTYEGFVPYFRGITYSIAIFAAPAAGLLAIRAIWDAGKTEEITKMIPKVPK